MCNHCVIENVKQNMLSLALGLFKGMAFAGAASPPRRVFQAGSWRSRAQTRSWTSPMPMTRSSPDLDGNSGHPVRMGRGVRRQWLPAPQTDHLRTHGHPYRRALPFQRRRQKRRPDRTAATGRPARDHRHHRPRQRRRKRDRRGGGVEAWISANGEIPEGAVVALRSGLGKKVSEPAFRNDGEGKFAFPVSASRQPTSLATLNVAAIGVDTLSLDPGNSARLCRTQQLAAGRALRDRMPEQPRRAAVSGATIMVGAPKHKRGTGGPARVLALV